MVPHNQNFDFLIELEIVHDRFFLVFCCLNCRLITVVVCCFMFQNRNSNFPILPTISSLATNRKWSISKQNRYESLAFVGKFSTLARKSLFRGIMPAGRLISMIIMFDLESRTKHSSESEQVNPSPS